MEWEELNRVLIKYGAAIKKETDRVLVGTKLKDKITYTVDKKEQNLFFK